MSSTAHHTPDVTGTALEEGADEIARTYAVALLNSAESQGETDAVLDELDELSADVFRDQPEFARLLSFGISDPERRDQLLTSAFEGRALPTVLRFLRVLNRRNRLRLIPAIAVTARAIWDRRNNRVPVAVKTAVPLDDSQRESLKHRLLALTGGATPMLSEEVEPEILGGLVVQVGDQLFDASIRGRLRRIRAELTRGRAGEIRRRTDLVTD
ncbi:ATP synthase F1 subunit delta [Tautonia plasticadhaerens]|uniref:ATP synthase subunit delta n=1 Tax=Tautonia plasticadhaerens TaxID=2527974 RepID=A0A518H8B2_9BACT|nr:ATP synthase F1 subunit delta [Tautonia plasticadhaerens]QDV37041.1 ATP synthase subunit delta [Tautonia plasticadhaerens]